MDVVNSTPRRTATARADEGGSRDLQRKPIENENARIASQTATIKNSVDTRTVPAKRQKPGTRENRAPLGPRPPDFTSRRVVSDVPVQITTSPRRSQLPNATSEPFLGLSARKKPSQPTGTQAVSSRSKDIKGAATTLQSNMNRSLTPETKVRVDTDKRVKAHIKSAVSATPKGGLSGSSSVRSRNPALAAAQISTASASGTSVVTPLNVRTRKQPRQTSSVSSDVDTSSSNKLNNVGVAAPKQAESHSVDPLPGLNTRAIQSQVPTGVTRKPSSTRPQTQSTSGSSSLEAVGSISNSDSAAEKARHQRLTLRQTTNRLAPILSDAHEESPKVKSKDQIQPKSIHASIISSKHHKEHPQNVGTLARTISPTDARRPKHASELMRSSPTAQTSPSPDSMSVRKRRIPSPSFLHRKSDSSSSPRISPDGNQGFSIGQPLSSRSSYSSLRAPSSSLQQRTVPGNQTVRNTNLKPRNTHSPVGDLSEVVPPVPAIPKVYGSPKGPSEEPFYFNFDNSGTTPSQSVGRGKNVAQQTIQTPPSFHDPRHKRGLTIASGLGASSSLHHENAIRQSSQQVKLPPLNLLPISKPTADKIDALGQRGRLEEMERMTPPLSQRANGTPSTPMTASKGTVYANDHQFNAEANKLPVMRSFSSHYLPRPTSSGGSSRAVFVTPSPAASPVPFSPVGSLPGSLDVEQIQRREKERNEMLLSHKVTETVAHGSNNNFRHLSRDLPMKSTLAGNTERTVTIGSPTHRNFSHAWNAGSSRVSQASQQFGDSISSHASASQDMSVAKAMASARRSVSMNPMPHVSLQGMESTEAKARLPTITATNKDLAKTSRIGSQGSGLTTRDVTASHTSTALTIKPSAGILAPVHKVLSSRPSLHALKRRQSDAGADKDEIAADEEMKKLASKRKDFEVAAKELDELRRRASPKERMSPSQAARTENLNIFERGEIIDYKDVYFCGLKTAKKFVGDLSSQAANFGFDDDRGDYNLVMGDHLAFRYEVIDLLGKGSFGQVVRCIDHKTGSLVAVKIIRNKKRFHQQALVEVNILQLLREWDPNCQHSMINFTQSFYFRGHLCISTELLDMNLYEFIKAHDFRGFSLKLIRRFTKQILSSLVLLQSHNVIHCDLKPENILLSHPLRSELKVIDFGSSCFQNEKVYTYIQSRFYRSPEVLLGMNYGMPIDMWSLGCIIAELYTGYPIFPGENEQEQMACIMEVFGPPEKNVLELCTRRKLFFDSSGKPRPTVSSKGKRRRPSSKQLQQAIKCDDEAFLDFISRCLRWDPEKRLKPDEAMMHEFVTGSKKRPRGPTASTNGPISPTKRFIPQTPSQPRPLPELPATMVKPGSAVPGPSASPTKGQTSLRRHSTISGLPQSGLNTRVLSGISTAPSSALPRAIPRSMSGKSDLASAAALASIVSEDQPLNAK